MVRRTIRRRCEQRVDEVLRDVGLPTPWDLDKFLDQLECHRARPIDLLRLDGALGSITGLWQRQSDHDVIAYPANTTLDHQDQIVLHEVGHMLFDHTGVCVLADAAAIAPSLAPRALAHLLGSARRGEQEAEAEIFATVLLVRAHASLGQAVARGELTARVAETFG